MAEYNVNHVAVPVQERRISREELALRVGPLLYTPANNVGVAEKICRDGIPGLCSIALDLEDSVSPTGVVRAEDALLAILDRLAEETALRGSDGFLPLVFVRVRSPEHLKALWPRLVPFRTLLTGFILPKFDHLNAGRYMESMAGINGGYEPPLYAMPILESASIAHKEQRLPVLAALDQLLEPVRDMILNIRVGGNDLCNFYAVRRGIGQTIYDVGPVRDALVDVVSVFAWKYVVSAPVWEYYGSAEDLAWKQGLERELELDRLNGFTGKTAIHLSQLPVIRDSLRVTQTDYEDARRILGWQNQDVQVAGNFTGQRMNEVSVHRRWAEKTLALAGIYGLTEDML